MDQTVKGKMGVNEGGMGELEEGELASGNESDGSPGNFNNLPPKAKNGKVRKLGGRVAVLKNRESEVVNRRVQHYEPTPPRGYRTPAGQRLRDRWKKRSPSHNLKFKYHGTMDLIRKSGNSYPLSQWRPSFGSPSASPSRKPVRSEHNLSPAVNVSENNKNLNSPDLKELVKRPLRKKIVPKSLNSVRAPPSPVGDVEDLDYIDLLLEYKQIQKQLEHLSKEEAETVTEEVSELKTENSEQPDLSTAEKSKEDKADETKDEPQNDVEESTSQNKDSQDTGTTESATEIDEDEAQRLLEEEELNELRLAALASAAKGVTPTSNERGPGAKSHHEKHPANNSHRGASRTDATKRSKDLSHRENLPVKRKRPSEDDRNLRWERNVDRDERRLFGTRRDRDDRFRRDKDERRDRDWRRDDRFDRRSAETERRSRQSIESDGPKSDDRTMSLARVLALDSHEEQVDRFVQILQDRNAQVGGGSRHNSGQPPPLMDSYEATVENFVRRIQCDQVSTMRPSLRTWSKEYEYWSRMFDDRIDTRDNYEEVEMDLGSEPASPVHIPGFIEANEVPLPLMSRFPIEFPHSLPYDTDFLYNPVPRADSLLLPHHAAIPPLLDPSSLHMNAAQPPPPPPPLPSHPPPSHPPPPSPQPPLLPQSLDVEVAMFGDQVSSKSDTSDDENREADLNEDDEDEDLLRAALLYELAQKRREGIANQSASSSPAPLEISPKVMNTLPRNDSSQSLQPMTIGQMPLVEPVVITIGNESSDESENEVAKSSRKVAVGLDGQLDLFLAMQRQTVENKLKAGKGQSTTDSPNRKSKSEAVEIAQELETHLRKVRASLVQDDSRLNAVRSQLGKRKRALITAELKAAKLREQLAAADRIIAVTKDQTERLATEATRLQARINNSYSQVEQLEQQTLAAGKAAYGEVYNLGIHLQSGDTTQSNKPETSNHKSPAKTREKLAEDIAREKARLKEREREVADKLKVLKEVQAKARSKKKNAVRIKQKRVKLKTMKSSEHIHTTPVMSFNFGPEIENEMTVITPKRRRSLADMSPGTVPNLPNLSKDVSSNLFNKIPEDKKLTSTKAKVAIVMPNQKQMASLNRMLGVSKMPASARHSNLTIKYRFDSEECLKTPQLNVVSGNKSIKNSGNCPTGLQKYNSPLQMFRGYRISPYFRTKSKNVLISNTYSHKLDHQRLLCHYDLHGKCQDEKCVWQHKDDYILNKREILMDIAAYLPSIADVKPKASPQEVQKKLEEFAEEFLKKNSQFSHEQQCLLLLSEVISKAQRKLPHMMAYDARKWKPMLPRNDAPSKAADTKLMWSSKGLQDLNRNEDDVLLDGDIRYWMLGTSEIQDMETAVLEAPNNINLWINLANKKLHNPKQSNDKNIDGCLNVLSKGLELNRNSSDLWLYYLKTYGQRSNNSEMLHLCEQALKYAPTYHLHCKYMNFLESYQSREGHCDLVLKWLVKEADVKAEQCSHWVLEILLYKVALATNCGRFRNALKALQQIVLGGSDRPQWILDLLGKLTAQDTSILWLCYIHLVEFRFLPPTLFDPANSHRSAIVSKEPFLFPWDLGKPTRNSVEYLGSRFKEAVDIVKAKESDEKLSEYQWHIYRNWILVEVVCKRLENARNKCRQLLQLPSSKSVEIWLLLFSIEKSADNIPEARKVLEEAQEQFPFSSYLVHNSAMFELSQGDVDSALEKLEHGIVNMFDIDLDDKRADPNLLYCKCLSQPLPLQYNCPDMKDQAQTADFPKQELYLWLNYWLLLELHGDRTQANEVFELALGVQNSAENIHTLWRRYIQYQLFQYYQQTSAVPSAKVIEGKLVDLLYRALLSLPSKTEVPLQPGVFWLNYSSHNDLIDMVLSCCPDHCLTSFLEKLIVWMPDNAVLMQRACEHFIKEGNRAAARGISMTALQHHPACLSLWKIHMAQIQREGSYSEVKKLYRRALKHINLTLSLWKDLLVFEMVCGNEKSVEQVVMQCEEKGLNIHEFLSSICGNGEAAFLPSALGPKLTKQPPAKSLTKS